MLIADVDLEDRKNKLDTGQTLKPAKTKRKNSAQSPSAPRTKKLKVEETNKASNFKSEGNSTETPSTSTLWQGACKKEEDEDDCISGQSPLKKIKTESCPQGQPVRFPANASNATEEAEMNWDIVQVCAAFFFFSSTLVQLIPFLWTSIRVLVAKGRVGSFLFGLSVQEAFVTGSFPGNAALCHS